MQALLGLSVLAGFMRAMHDTMVLCMHQSLSQTYALSRLREAEA